MRVRMCGNVSAYIGKVESKNCIVESKQESTKDCLFYFKDVRSLHYSVANKVGITSSSLFS